MDSEFSRRAVLKTAGSVTLVSLGASAGSGAQAEIRPDVDGDSSIEVGGFTVAIDDVEVEGWETVTIPGTSTETGSYREDNDTDSEKKLWGQAVVDDLEMERQFQFDDARIRSWRDAVEAGTVEEARKTVTVELLDTAGTAQVRWKFENAWVKAYGPPLLSTATDRDPSTESVTLAFETMNTEWDPGTDDETDLASVADEIPGVSPDVLAAFDEENDGELTLGELRTAMEDWRADGNVGDQQVSSEELRSIVDWWKQEVRE